MASTVSSDGERALKPGSPPARRSNLPVTILRLLTFAATLSAFVTMITNKQKLTIVVAGIPFTRWSKYHYSDAFMWFVVANGVAFGYALLATIAGAVSKSPKVTKHLVILDLLVANMIISAASAATAVGYIGNNGINEAGWSEICSRFEKYCHHVAGALVASFLGWLFLILATLLGMRRAV